MGIKRCFNAGISEANLFDGAISITRLIICRKNRKQLDEDIRLPLNGKFERQFYEESSRALSNFISILELL